MDFEPNNTFLKVYPYPATEHVTVEFKLKLPAKVNLKMLDLDGKTVRIFANELFPQGTHLVKTTLSSIHSGAYIIVFEQGEEVIIRKLSVK